MSRKTTVAIADLHQNTRGQLHRTLNECVLRAGHEVAQFGPAEFEIVVAGDSVAGQGIYRRQEKDATLPHGFLQCWWLAQDIRNWNNTLERKPSRWVFVFGNHDNADGEDLIFELVMILQLMGVNAVYMGRSYVGNFAMDERPDMWFEAEHGFGGSQYYPNSIAQINECRRIFIQTAQTKGLHISRFLRGHTHWMHVGHTVGFGCHLDTPGGWHRQDRAQLASDARETGVLVYYHDGERLHVEQVGADCKLLLEETYDVNLPTQNMRAAAAAIEAVTAWAQERGLCGQNG